MAQEPKYEVQITTAPGWVQCGLCTAPVCSLCKLPIENDNLAIYMHKLLTMNGI